LAKLQTALSFPGNAEGDVIFDFKIPDKLNWHVSQEKITICQYVYFIGRPQPVILIKIPDSHAALADIDYPGYLGR
jgi:hypothetical protein